MIIYTVCRYGQILAPEVLSGVADNECALMIVSSRSAKLKGGDRKNMNENLEVIMEYLKSPLFISIDSDVALSPGCVARHIEEMGDANALYIRGLDVSGKLESQKHHIRYIRTDFLRADPIDWKNYSTCPWCAWRIKHNIRLFDDITVKEILREELI